MFQIIELDLFDKKENTKIYINIKQLGELLIDIMYSRSMSEVVHEANMKMLNTKN